MAHETDKLIRDKVAEAESIPVLWNRSRVFENIRANAEPAFDVRLFYYAAAVILLALLASAYLYQSWQQNLKDRIVALENEIKKKSAEMPVVLEDLPGEIITGNADCPKLITTPVAARRKNALREIEKDIEEPLEIRSVALAPESETDRIVDEPRTMKKEELDQTLSAKALSGKKTVVPVIGHIPPDAQPEPIVAKRQKRKRSRIDMFLPPTNEFTTNPQDESHSFTARLN